MDLPWNNDLAIEGSNKYNNLVDEFTSQVGFPFASCVLCQLYVALSFANMGYFLR